MNRTLLRDFTIGTTWMGTLIVAADHLPGVLVAAVTVGTALALLHLSGKELENE